MTRISIETEPSVLRVDRTGTIRIGATRVTLDSIITAFKGGSTAEQIAQGYPSVSLPDVYAVIGYYLRHQEELDEYLNDRRRDAGELRARSGLDRSDIRSRLLARRSSSCH